MSAVLHRTKSQTCSVQSNQTRKATFDDQPLMDFTQSTDLPPVETKQLWRSVNKEPPVNIPKLPEKHEAIAQRVPTAAQRAALERPTFEDRLYARHQQREEAIRLRSALDQQQLELAKVQYVTETRSHTRSLVANRQQRREALEDGLGLTHPRSTVASLNPTPRGNQPDMALSAANAAKMEMSLPMSPMKSK